MKNIVVALLALLVLTGCTTGQATRTSSNVYQPTDATKVQIFVEKPERAYEVVGLVGSKADGYASDDAVIRAMQKEAAELGANAIYMKGDIGVEHDVLGGKLKSARAVAIRWKTKSDDKAIAVTPTSNKPTTPKEEQIIPKE